MEQIAERMLASIREKVKTFYQQRYVERNPSVQLNLYKDVVEPFQKETTDVVNVLSSILVNPDARDMHYWVHLAMRSLAMRGQLPRKGIEIVLQQTDRFAAWDGDGWFRCINAVASSSDGVASRTPFFRH